MNEPSLYTDDPSIRDSCQLLRRINCRFVVPDKNNGGYRISSGAFNDPEMSIHIGDDLREDDHMIDDIMQRYADWDMAAITAGTARNEDQAVCRDPLPDELCHGLVVGPKSKSTRKTFAREAMQNWVVRRTR